VDILKLAGFKVLEMAEVLNFNLSAESWEAQFSLASMF
jgi:hypothetical protein